MTVEAGQETNIETSSAGPILSGTFHSAVHLLQQAKDAELPAELQNVNLRKFQLATADAVVQLSDRIETWFRENERERLERQKVTDEHRDNVAAKLGAIGQSLELVARLALISQILSSVAIGVCVVLVLDFGHRSGWW